MADIRELSFDEIASVSGGESMMGGSNRETDRNCNGSAQKSGASKDIYAGTDACVGSLVFGVGGGAFTGGVKGAIVGVGSAIQQCLSNNGSTGNGSNAGSNKCSDGGVAGKCNR